MTQWISTNNVHWKKKFSNHRTRRVCVSPVQTLTLVFVLCFEPEVFFFLTLIMNILSLACMKATNDPSLSHAGVLFSSRVSLLKQIQLALNASFTTQRIAHWINRDVAFKLWRKNICLSWFVILSVASFAARAWIWTRAHYLTSAGFKLTLLLCFH